MVNALDEGGTIRSSDDLPFDPRGEVQIPKRLSPGHLGYIGHLLSNAVGAISSFAEFAEEEESRSILAGAKRRLQECICHLLARFGRDIDEIAGLRRFLLQLDSIVEREEWGKVYSLYLAADRSFNFRSDIM